MAAGFARALADDVEVFAAGSEPADLINPMVTAVMAEVDIDISGQRPTRWTDDCIQSADVVVTMGCGDECPRFTGPRYVDWDLDDPAGLPIGDVRLIRDEIEKRVKGLVAGLGVI